TSSIAASASRPSSSTGCSRRFSAARPRNVTRAASASGSTSRARSRAVTAATCASRPNRAKAPPSPSSCRAAPNWANIGGHGRTRMANASEWARRFEEWTSTLSKDVTATWDMLTNESVAAPGRRWLAAALSYTLTQLDLIPDHERAGSIDDAFVLRIAYGLAAEHAGKTSTDDTARIARM